MKRRMPVVKFFFHWSVEEQVWDWVHQQLLDSIKYFVLHNGIIHYLSWFRQSIKELNWQSKKNKKIESKICCKNTKRLSFLEQQEKINKVTFISSSSWLSRLYFLVSEDVSIMLQNWSGLNWWWWLEENLMIILD